MNSEKITILIKNTKTFKTAKEEIEDLFIPEKKSQTAHCFDLAISENVSIAPGQTKILNTGIKMEIPAGYAVLIHERSSTVTKLCANIEAGIIDSDYRGEVGIVLSKKPKISFFNIIQQVSTIFSLGNFFMHPINFIKLMYSIYRKRNCVLKLHAGQRIAQLEVVKTLDNVKFEPTVCSLSVTERKSGGFGSTGC